MTPVLITVSLPSGCVGTILCCLQAGTICLFRASWGCSLQLQKCIAAPGQRHGVIHSRKQAWLRGHMWHYHSTQLSPARNRHLFTPYLHPPRLIIGILLGLMRAPSVSVPSASQNTSAKASSKCPASTALSLEPAASSSVCWIMRSCFAEDVGVALAVEVFALGSW